MPGNGIFPAMASLEEELPRPVTVSVKFCGGDFLRLAAKIAHGFAVATVGLDRFSPFLTDIILGRGRSSDDLWKYVGGIGDNKRIDAQDSVGKECCPNSIGDRARNYVNPGLHGQHSAIRKLRRAALRGCRRKRASPTTASARAKLQRRSTGKGYRRALQGFPLRHQAVLDQKCVAIGLSSPLASLMLG